MIGRPDPQPAIGGAGAPDGRHVDESVEVGEPAGGTTGRSGALRGIAFAVLVVAAAFFVWTRRGDIPATRDAVTGAAPFWLIVAVVLGLAFMVNQAMFYGAAQRALGVRLPHRALWNGSNAAFFVNTVAKSGGLAGVASFSGEAKRHGLSHSRTVAAYVVVAVLGQLGFAMSLMVAIVVLVGAGNFTGIEAIAAIVFGVYTIVLTVSVVAGFRSRRLLRWIHAAPTRAMRWIGARFGRVPSDHPVDTTQADELFEALQLLRRRPLSLTITFVHAVLVEVIAVAMLWAVLQAVGANAGPSVALVAYSISVMFLIVGVLPGGLGFVEASLGVVLAGYGIPVPTVAAAVVLYRLLELWLPLTVGAVAVRRLRT